MTRRGRTTRLHVRTLLTKDERRWGEDVTILDPAPGLAAWIARLTNVVLVQHEDGARIAYHRDEVEEIAAARD